MEITFEEFQKIEMKIGKVIDVQEIPQSKNLLKLVVDFGNEKRQSVAGLKTYFKKEDLIGKKYVFVTNLEKKKMMGEVSECMILAAIDDSGNLSLITPEKDIKEGSKIK
ncbi:MAG: methionine--tRNA ligase subunit beta [Candidatus Aenigmatarchaeota archaeon]